jgi:hypothetical protein
VPGQKSTDASRKIAYHWRARLRRRTRESARHWSYLAEQQEKGTDVEGPIPPALPAESQSAAQQQQQVQPKDEDKKE